ncbi:MAG TPA: hypothetical protein VGM23_03945 [Armatimonadota bacterium]|jgi:hypothetical protein
MLKRYSAFIHIFVFLVAGMPIGALAALPPDLFSPWRTESQAQFLAGRSANLAQAQGVRALSNNKLLPGASPAAQVLDAKLRTEWASADANSELLVIFPASVRVNGISLQRNIQLEHPYDVGIGHRFVVDVSADGKSWEQIAESRERITHWAVSFPVRQITQVRVRGVSGMRIGELGVFLVEKAARDLGWADPTAAYRTPIEMACVRRQASGICSAGANLAGARGNAAGIVLPASIRVAVGYALCPTLYVPGDMKRSESGVLNWSEQPHAAGQRWLYFNTVPAAAVTPPATTGAWAADGTLEVDNVQLKDAVPGRPMLVDDRWVLPPSRAGVRCGITADFDNYLRGKPLAVTAVLENSEKDAFIGTLTFSLAGRGTVPLLSRPVEIAPGQKLELVPALDISRAAHGDYLLITQLRRENIVYAECRRPVYIAPAARPGMGFGIYSLPYCDGNTGYQKGLRAAAEAGFTEVTGQFWGETYSFIGDQVLRYGMRWSPTIEPIYNQNNLPDTDPTAACTGPDGKRLAWHPNTCYTHPDVVKRTEADAEKWLRQIAAYPAFNNRIFADDDVHLADQGCYNASCRALFKQVTGLEVPETADGRLPKIMPPPGIIPDNNAWLQWHLFRCSQVRGNLPKIYMRAKERACPQAKMGAVRGHMQFPFFTPHTGEYPPLFDALYDFPGSYAYLYWVRQNQDYIAHTALARMGNRDKKPALLADFACWPSWILAPQGDGSWGLDLLKSLQTERTGGYLYPPGVMNKEIWCLVAGGCDFIHMFVLPETGGPNDLQGTEQQAVLQRWGNRARTYGPLLTALKEPDRPVAVLASITASAFTDGLTPGSLAAQVFKDCLHQHVPVDMIAEEEILAGRLSKVKVLLLPNVQYLRRSVYEAIERYMADGGFVIADPAAAVHPTGARLAPMREMAKVAGQLVQGGLTCDNPSVVIREFLHDGVRYYTLVNVWTDRWTPGYGDDPTMQGDSGNFTQPYMPRAQRVTLQLPAGVRLAYDVFGNRALRAGADGTLQVTIGGDDGLLLALLPKPVETLRLWCPSRIPAGDKATVALRLLSSDGSPVSGGVPVDIRVIAPDGSESEYSAHVIADGGIARYEFTTAVNDTPGKWTVTARALVGNASGSASYVLLQR